MKKKNKLSDKITEHAPDIIFGILSGEGLMFTAGAITIILTLIFPILQSLFIIIYIIFYLFILISTSILYIRGWFRITYIASSLILSLAYLYTKIFVK